MSSPLAIGAVSAVLRNLLDNGLVDVSGVLGPVDGERGRARPRSTSTRRTSRRA